MAILLIHTIHMRKQTGCRSALQTLKLLKANPQSSAMAGSGQTCQTCAPMLTEHARNPQLRSQQESWTKAILQA